MKTQKKLLGVAIISALTLGGVYSQTASAQTLLGWDINTSNAGGTTTSVTYLSGFTPANEVNNLGFNGESFVVISGPPSSGPFTFIDNGVYNFTTYNGGPLLELGSGQLTAVLRNGVGYITGSSGSFTDFTFTGGLVDFYYNNAHTFGATATSNYGASTGTLIAEFSVQGGGGTTDSQGTPTNNTVITIVNLAQAINGVGSPATPASVWTLPSSVDLTKLLGFITSNAHLDLAYSAATSTKLSLAMTGSNAAFKNTFGPGGSFLVTNAGQFSLETPLAVPEPELWILMSLGLLGLGYSKKRKAR
jgi:hypothetical protein